MSTSFTAAIRATIALAVIAFTSSTSAAAYQWSFGSSDGSFGGLIAGSFIHDVAGYSDWNIITAQNPLQHQTDQATAHYTVSSSGLETFSGGVRISDHALIPSIGTGWLPTSTLTLHFAPLLQDGNVVHGYMEEVFNSSDGRVDYRSGNFALTGAAVAAPVPEPEAVLMGVLGLTMVAATIARRRQRTNR